MPSPKYLTVLFFKSFTVYRRICSPANGVDQLLVWLLVSLFESQFDTNTGSILLLDGPRSVRDQQDPSLCEDLAEYQAYYPVICSEVCY